MVLDCLHLRFDEQAARTPAAIAAVCDDETITYEELAARARRVAAFLLAHGIRHNELIGIYQERSIPFIVAMIGALKAGACCVPIDPAYTAERVALIINKAGLGFLLVDTAKPPHCPDSVRVLT